MGNHKSNGFTFTSSLSLRLSSPRANDRQRNVSLRQRAPGGKALFSTPHCVLLVSAPLASHVIASRMSFSFRLSWTYASRAEPVPSFPSTILSMEVVSLRHDALSIIRSRSLASSSARHVSLHECAQFPREQTRLPACSPPSLHVCPGVLVRASLFPASDRSLLG